MLNGNISYFMIEKGKGEFTIKFKDIVEFYINAVKNLKEGIIELCSPLEEIVIKSAGNLLAYIDNRQEAFRKYNFNLWKDVSPKGMDKKLLYSRSQLFPDFLFKVRKVDGGFTCGSLLELKDSEGGNIASFNSTIPTEFKSLEEIDVINGKNLVSKIASIMDNEQINSEYYKYARHCFYLVRTHRCKKEKVKLSVVDGSFFETIPKEHLFHQLFLQILYDHINKKGIRIPKETLEKVKGVLTHITDQTIIAASRTIEGASIRPRLRVMAEVHGEGNPHSATHYPEISEGSFNLILKLTPQAEALKEELVKQNPELRTFVIRHKRNGQYLVFQFNLSPQKKLLKFLPQNK